MISVVIPVHRPPEVFYRLLASLDAQRLDEPWELLVADDATPEPDAGRIAAAVASLTGPEARLLRLPENRGPGAARNMAVAQARGEVLVFLDADCLVDSDLHLQALLDAHRAHPKAIIGGAVRGFGKGYAAWCDHYCHWSTNIPGVAPGPIRRRHLVTAHLLVPRSAWDLAGPLDEELRTGEDTAFCHRARRLGLELRLHGDIQVRHHDRERWADLYRCFHFVGRDRAQVRERVLGTTHPALHGPWLLRALVSPAVTGMCMVEYLRAWLPHDRRVLLALPGLLVASVAMAAGVVAGPRPGRG